MRKNPGKRLGLPGYMPVNSIPYKNILLEHHTVYKEIIEIL